MRFWLLTIFFIITNTIFAQNSFSNYKKVDNNGLDIYYRIFGEGKPLLIIGGGPGDLSDRYLGLCNLLSDSIQCILVDQRGTGKSRPEIMDSSTINITLTLEDFEAIREDLKLNEWNVLGFSYGGYLASLYVNKFPESVSSLVLLGPMGLNLDSFRFFADNINSGLTSDDMMVVEYWSDSTRYSQNPSRAIFEIVKAKMPGYFYSREKSLQVTQTMKEEDFDFGMGQWIWKDIFKNNYDILQSDLNFHKRVLILHGRQDPLGESTAITVKNYFTNSELKFVEKSGHYSWLEQPEFIKTEINNFLK